MLQIVILGLLLDSLMSCFIFNGSEALELLVILVTRLNLTKETIFSNAKK